MIQNPTHVVPATPGIKTLAVATRWVLWIVFAAWSLFALSWVALHGVIVPRIGEARPLIERWASASLGLAVRLGEVRADSGSGWLPAFMPALELRDVRLLDEQGRQVLHLPLVHAALSVGSLWRLGFEQVVIEQPVLDVRRDAQGRIKVAGLDLLGPGDDAALDWFFSQSEFVIRGGTLRWTDELRAQPPLVLQGLELVARNGVRAHQIRLDATPPPEWGQRFSLRGHFRQPWLAGWRAGAAEQPIWQSWDGELYADFPQLDLLPWRAAFDGSVAGLRLHSGRGALRAWAGLRQGKIESVTTDLALRDVQAQLQPQRPALALAQLDGRLQAQWNSAGLILASEDLRFRTREGLLWPAARWRLERSAARPGRAEAVSLSADRLELATLSALARHLPLDSADQELLASLAPAGRVEGLNARWQGGGADAAAAAKPLSRYQAQGRVVGLSLQGRPSGRLSPYGNYPLPGRPGISGATLEFDFNHAGGQAQLSIENGVIELPDVFEDPRIALQQLSAAVRWRVQGEHIEVELERLQAANADLEGTAQARWHTSDAALSPARSRFPGVLDLNARLTRADATRVHRYLPLSVLPDARRYVREAVRAGSASRVDFRIRGDLYDMPFHSPASRQAAGEFRIGALLHGVELDYVPPHLQSPGDLPWPALRGASAEFLLDRSALKISGLQAGVQGAPNVRLHQAGVTIDDVYQSVLVAHAQLQGPAHEVLAFVQHSPLNQMTQRALAQARISGALSGQFRLQVPIFDSAASRVSGTLRLSDNDVQFSPDTPLLARSSASVAFSETGFYVTQAQARLYGGVLRFEGGMQPEANGQSQIEFRGQGTASAEGLRDAGLGYVSRLFRHASGSSAYSAQLRFRAGVPELLVSSNLQGMAIGLPAPLNKSAAAYLPLRFENTVLSVLDARAHTDRLLLELGTPLAPLARLDFERDISSAEPRVLRGSVALGLASGAALPMPAQGVAASMQFDQIDVDAWARAFTAVTGADARSPVSPSPPVAAALSASLDYLPSVLALRAERLTLAGRSFHRVVAGGSRAGTQWRANLAADEFSGYIEYHQGGAQTAGSVFARLTHLQLEPTAVREVEQLLQHKPDRVPALDIVVDALSLAGRHLGRVEVQAVNRGALARPGEWHLTRLQVSLPEARLSASGNWAAAARRTALQLRLEIDDSGRLLERFGHAGLVRGGKGRIEGSLSWLGSPLALDYASLSGQLRADIERGQFLQVDPGAAKLLSVLSLQSLPRRLALDFRDVFSEGFAFDFVRGDARVERGVLWTNNLQMKGVNAAVLMEGSADLAREQQDLRVVVVPEINAGTASLIATAINPAVGLGSFLAQFLLRQPLQSAATQHFHISGSWADPKVERTERRAPAHDEAQAPTPTLQ